MKCLVVAAGNETTEIVTCLSLNVLLLQHVFGGLKLLRIAHKMSCFLSYLKFGIDYAANFESCFVLYFSLKGLFVTLGTTAECFQERVRLG